MSLSALKGTLLTVSLLKQDRGPPCSTSAEERQETQNFHPLHMSTNDHRSATGIDVGAANRHQQMCKFRIQNMYHEN